MASYDIVRFQANTSSGNQTIPHGLGEVPKLAIFLNSDNQEGSADFNTWKHNEDLTICLGATDGTNRFAGGASFEANVTSHDAENVLNGITCVISVSEVSTVATAGFISWNASNVVISWVDAPTDDMTIIMVVIGGAEVEAAVGVETTPTVTGNKSTSVGFQPDSLITLTTEGDNLGWTPSDFFFGVGFSDGSNNGAIAGYAEHGTTNAPGQNISAHALVVLEALAAIRISATATFDSNGFILNYSAVDTAAANFGYIAIKGVKAKVGSFNTSSISSAGTDISTTDMRPRVAMFLGTNRNALGADTNELMSVVGVGEPLQGTNYCVSIYNKGATESLLVTDTRVYAEDGDADSTDEDGLALNAIGATEQVFTVARTSGATNSHLIYYLVLGGSIEQKFVSGTSANSGTASTRILSVLDEIVTGISSSAGEIFRSISWTVDGTSLNTGELETIVKGGIQIKVDRIKPSPADLNLGLGDETGFNNILTNSPVIEHLHPDEKVKNLKVKYRKNNRENDVYLHEIERSSSSNGVDQTISLPFIYDHDTADMVLDYKRKRFAAAVKRMSLEVGQDAVNANRSDLATVDIPSLGVSSSWEVTGTNLTPAGSQSLSLIPYSALPYTYEQGTILPDEKFDIPPDFSNTPPEPVTSVGISYQNDIDDQGRFQTFAVITFTPPEENFSEVRASIRKNGTSNWESAGSGEVRIRIPVVPGQRYDYQLVPFNESNISGLPDTSLTNQLVPGDTTQPGNVSGVSSSVKFNKATWQWNPLTEPDLKGYIYDIRTASNGNGSLIRTGFTEDTKLEYDLTTGSLTSSVTRYLRVKAVDYSGNESVSWSASSGAQTNSISTGDIGNDQINSQHYAPASIDDGHVNNLSANKITTGILTVDGNPGINVTGSAGIDVTGSGDITFESGGDIIMKAFGTNWNYIKFQTSGGNDRGLISYNSSGALVTLEAKSADLDLKSSNQVKIQAGTGGKIVLATSTGDIEPQASIIPDQDNQHRIGTNSPLRRWQSVFAVSVNTGDILFDNGYVLTEPDKVYRGQDQDTGLYLMNADYKPIAFFEKNGNVAVAGELFQKVEFEEPHYKAGEVNASERQEQKKLSERIDDGKTN